ncbi:MAG: Cof-type HAD-IIB family hydrolase, partial [Acutalibacteraceae bacterium]
MIKAIFFDLDGTLLNDQKRITDESKTSLQICKKNGIMLYVMTARPPLLEKQLQIDMSVFNGGIYYNGGYIETDDYSRYEFIPDTVVSNILSIVKEYNTVNLAVQSYNERHIFLHPINDFAYEKWGINSCELISADTLNDWQAVKVLLFYGNLYDSHTLIPQKLIEELKSSYYSDYINSYITDDGTVMQIVSKNTNKYIAVENIRKKYGWSVDDIVVFGNDYNDFEVLSKYKYSVAMGNSSDEIKSLARFVTKDNNSGGI